MKRQGETLFSLVQFDKLKESFQNHFFYPKFSYILVDVQDPATLILTDSKSAFYVAWNRIVSSLTPCFSMTKKSSLKLIDRTLKTLKFQHKLEFLRENPSKLNGADFQLVPNFDQIRIDLYEFVRSLPNEPGILIVSGFKRSKEVKGLLKITCPVSIRMSFGYHRYDWILSLIERNYVGIQLQIAIDQKSK
ncbi:MAG: hypothetical protein LW688_12105 [Cryomorphaceae bacterium]|nr:hypothetical protein [Cryomorphaceae bacterium]